MDFLSSAKPNWSLTMISKIVEASASVIELNLQVNPLSWTYQICNAWFFFIPLSCVAICNQFQKLFSSSTEANANANQNEEIIMSLQKLPLPLCAWMHTHHVSPSCSLAPFGNNFFSSPSPPLPPFLYSFLSPPLSLILFSSLFSVFSCVFPRLAPSINESKLWVG